MDKHAIIRSGLAAYSRYTGGFGGPTAPLAYKYIGGPVTAAAIRSLLHGGIGALWAGHGVEDPEERKRLRRMGALAGAATGLAVTAPALQRSYNAHGLLGLNKLAGLDMFRRHAGKGFPAGYTVGQISDDPYLSYNEKIQAIGLLREASGDGYGTVTAGDVARAAVGAGIGYVAGKALGHTLQAFFGEISPQAQRVMQGAGVIAGALKNTGALR